jgi:hypothetical protein
MRYTLLILLILPAFLFAQTFRKKYHGNIGPYPITITLVCKSGNLTGTYYYDSFDDPISIRGFVAGKSIRFHGFDLKGNMIDEFIGQVNKYDVQGIWIGEGMQKRFPFSLHEVYIPPPPLVTFFTPQRIFICILLLSLLSLGGFYFYARRTNRTPRWITRIQLRYRRLFSPRTIGYEFERYMTDRIDPHKYRLVEWKKTDQKKFKLSTYTPGLIFERKNAAVNARFGIACKYLEKISGESINIGKQAQDETDKATFVALGVGGKPSAPESVYMIPVENVTENKISLKDISRFKIQGTMVEYDPMQKTIYSL